MSNRRNFLQKTMLGIAGVSLVPNLGNATKLNTEQPKMSKTNLSIGIAGYTFAKFSLDQSILMMKRVGLTNLSLKEIHLPLNSSD